MKTGGEKGSPLDRPLTFGDAEQIAEINRQHERKVATDRVKRALNSAEKAIKAYGGDLGVDEWLHNAVVNFTNGFREYVGVDLIEEVRDKCLTRR